MAAQTLPIAEAFTSIQGEGVRTGAPSRFIRVAGCNLRCGWCDTPYASWAPEGDAVSIDALVQDAASAGVPDAVLTGGEPMLFDAIEPLSRALRAAGLHITIETAGTIHRPPANGDSGLACDLMSLSPKLSTSTPAADDPRDPTGVWRERHEQRRIDLESLQRLLNDYPCRQIKFVATAPADLAEIDQLLSRLTGWKPGEVMLMPEGVTTPKPGATDWVLQACLDRGWRYCHRLHIELFGNTRGT
ncbi:MAG: 7-carboxy-7-deazaguanine synthase QueE [Planctomycetota bacterium]